MNDFKTYLPRWTKRAVMDGSGRDPLGLSRISDNFTDLLLPSIITTTNRARYYSFYPWAMRESLNALKEDEDGADFLERFCRLEAAFAISSKLGKETDRTIVGIDQVNRYLDGADEGSAVNTEFKVLPANNWGGFGQYYGGALRTLGLGSWEEDGFWHATDQRGIRLADAFAESISGVPYLKPRHFAQEETSLKILKESATEFSLDAIRGRNAKNERNLLINFFFDLDPQSEMGSSTHRQATLGQLLHVLAACEDIGNSPSRRDIEGSCLFWPHYYRHIYGEDGVSVPYIIEPTFQVTSEYWRQFCAHQFFTYAAEEILQAILDSVSKTAEGLTKPQLVAELLSTEFVEELEKLTKRKHSGPRSLMNFFGAGKDPEAIQQKFSANYPLAEWWIYSGESETPAKTRLARAFLILAQLHAKWRLSPDAALADVSEKAASEWWLGTCLAWGDDWLEENPTWHVALESLIEEFHTHHEMIKFQKHKLDASWLEKTGDRYSRLQDLRPDFRSNRHANASMILQDLCLLQDGGNDDPLVLTPAGRSTLKQVIKIRS